MPDDFCFLRKEVSAYVFCIDAETHLESVNVFLSKTFLYEEFIGGTQRRNHLWNMSVWLGLQQRKFVHILLAHSVKWCFKHGVDVVSKLEIDLTHRVGYLFLFYLNS